MIVPRYQPGDWVAVVSDGLVALLPPDVTETTVDGVWSAVRGGARLGDVLDVLLRGGLGVLPAFAVVDLADGDVRAVVRGDVGLAAVAVDGEHLVDGRGVTTWREVALRRPDSVVVSAPGADEVRSGRPVLSGVVGASAVRVDVTAADAAPVAPEVRRGRRAATPAEAGSPQDPWPVPDPAPVPAATPAMTPVPPRAADPAPAEDGAAPAAASSLVPALVGEDAPVPGPVPVPVPVPVRAVLPEPGPTPAPAPLSSPVLADTPAPVPVDRADRADAADAADAADGEDVDHDGLTVLSSDVAALRRSLPEWAGDAVPGPLAVPAPDAPPPAKIHLSSGLVVSLNRPVLLGRAPQVSRVPNAALPRLVTVASPNQDISRTHAEVRQEGEHVLVTDLRSTNGVLLQRQGSGPQRLHPGEPTVVEPDVVVDLGEGVTFVVERTG